MPCQWRPTILSLAAGWVAADSDIYPPDGCYPGPAGGSPPWAGVARGRFKFHTHALASRTHGGLPTQAAIEARLGRSGGCSTFTRAVLDTEELIRSAKVVYQDLASSNPTTMGKSKACYSALYQITTIFRRLLADTPHQERVAP